MTTFTPSIKQLQYLVAVSELRHFGQAAERCFVTQSTLSTGIIELENLIGTPLFERTNRKVMPTPLGERLTETAREILALSQLFVDQAKLDHTPLTGSLKLGTIPTIAPFLLPKVLHETRKQYPQLELFLTEMQSQQLVEKLNQGELDCAILALPYPLGNLQHEIFWEESFLVALPSNHPETSHPILKSQDLPLTQILLLEEGHCLRDQALSACKLSGLTQQSTFQGTSLYTLLEMVAGGQGITFVPEMAALPPNTLPEQIQLRPLADPGPHRSIAFVWRKSYQKSAELKLLAASFKTILAKLNPRPV